MQLQRKFTIFEKQELNITPKPTKNKTKEALEATRVKETIEAQKAEKVKEVFKKARRLKWLRWMKRKKATMPEWLQRPNMIKMDKEDKG